QHAGGSEAGCRYEGDGRLDVEGRYGEGAGGLVCLCSQTAGDVDGGECVCFGEGRSDEDEYGSIRHCAYVRPLWPVGGVSADEWDCSSGKPEVRSEPASLQASGREWL